MKKNDILELRTKTHEELSRMLMDLRLEAQKMHIEVATGKARNSNASKNKKKDIARVLTFLSMKEAVAKQEVTKEVEPVK